VNRAAVRLVAIVAALLLAPVVRTAAATPTPAPGSGLIGIRLVDTPGERSSDPRSQIYIVDHLVPGAVIRRRIQVDSTIDTPLAVEMFAGAASVSGDSFAGAEGRATNELTSWMSLDRSSVTLPPRGSAPVEVTIQVPSNASSGKRYAIVWAQTTSRLAAPGVMTLVTRVGMRVYLDVGLPGEPTSAFEIRNLTGARSGDGQPEVIAQVENTGQRPLDMLGDLDLSEGPGSLSAGPFPAKTGSTLAPGGTGDVVVLLNRQLPAGPWKARLRLASGTLQRTATATIRFPPVSETDWRPIVVEVAGLLLLLAAGFSFLRRLRRRRRGRSGPISPALARTRPR
jgi:hypothetical protein